MNATGQSQASMGLTVGDANGDQLLDFYVGTFYHDSNTLFLQNSADTFSDETRTAGLREPTFKMLTFGAQFLDADLDGWPDICPGERPRRPIVRPERPRSDAAPVFPEIAGMVALWSLPAESRERISSSSTWAAVSRSWTSTGMENRTWVFRTWTCRPRCSPTARQTPGTTWP